MGSAYFLSLQTIPLPASVYLGWKWFKRNHLTWSQAALKGARLRTYHTLGSAESAGRDKLSETREDAAYIGLQPPAFKKKRKGLSPSHSNSHHPLQPKRNFHDLKLLLSSDEVSFKTPSSNFLLKPHETFPSLPFFWLAYGLPLFSCPELHAVPQLSGINSFC